MEASVVAQSEHADVPGSVVSMLRGLWTKLGCSAEELDIRMDAVHEKLREYLAETVREAERELSAALGTVEVLHVEVSQLCAALGVPHTNEHQQQQMPLQERIRILTARRDELHHQVTIRSQRMHENLTRMHFLWTERLEEPADELVGCDDGTFSVCCAPELISALCKFDAQRERAVETRMKEIERLVVYREDQLLSELRLIVHQLTKLHDSQSYASEAQGCIPCRHPVDELALGCQDSGPSGTQCVAQTKLGATSMQRVRERLNELKRETAERTQKLNALIKHTQAMFELLQIPKDKLNQMLREHSDISADSIETWQRELAHLRQMKRTRLELLIEDAESALHEDWRAFTMSRFEKSEHERRLRSFKATLPIPAVALGGSDADNVEQRESALLEQILSFYQSELSALRLCRPRLEKILALEEKREHIAQTRQELERDMQQKDRLLSRSKGSHTSLLRQEKLRKQVENLPKLYDALLTEIDAYENETHRALVLDSCYSLDNTFTPLRALIVQAMEHDEEERKLQKEKLLAKRGTRALVSGANSGSLAPPRGAPIPSSAQKHSHSAGSHAHSASSSRPVSVTSRSAVLEKENRHASHRQAPPSSRGMKSDISTGAGSGHQSFTPSISQSSSCYSSAVATPTAEQQAMTQTLMSRDVNQVHQRPPHQHRPRSVQKLPPSSNRQQAVVDWDCASPMMKR
ncbi:Anaphase spindle elongation protein 1 [Porphyridium purpureum]|uniref:Anaphase spindle elongation protein 1 n=1 Tax=Porphyridium purpureum TaxID=35688 RepID=A0A5J4YRW8_PORPP|nr:Anaphase spindle elongation protein 1 [Porphyridium purpureum]|eukprot:POR6598..scf296_7